MSNPVVRPSALSAYVRLLLNSLLGMFQCNQEDETPTYQY